MRVAIPFHLACGYCPYCRSGEQNLCENRIVLHRTPGSGGWAQYMRAPNADLNCVPLPEGVDEMAAAALGCRYMTAWHAIQSKGEIRGGKTVAIFGCGGIGLAATRVRLRRRESSCKIEVSKFLGAARRGILHKGLGSSGLPSQLES